MNNKLRDFSVSIVAVIVFTVVCGVGFPLAVAAFSSVLFQDQAGGSLVKTAKGAVGSSLIGQSFTREGYFHGRPSATSPAYNGMASSGSNLGPTNPALKDAVTARVLTERAGVREKAAGVPIDLVTASGSGLDPHITPEAARFQIERVAAARHVDAAAVRAVVDDHVEGRTLFVLGEPRVNVLALNLAVDAAFAAAVGAPPAPPAAPPESPPAAPPEAPTLPPAKE